jgi:hypothetical protein
LTAADLAAADFRPVDLADFFALADLEAVDLAVDVLVPVDFVACPSVNSKGANTANAADRATGMEMANERKDPV